MGWWALFMSPPHFVPATHYSPQRSSRLPMITDSSHPVYAHSSSVINVHHLFILIGMLGTLTSRHVRLMLSFMAQVLPISSWVFAVLLMPWESHGR